jgi:hypothetical protein
VVVSARKGVLPEIGYEEEKRRYEEEMHRKE